MPPSSALSAPPSWRRDLIGGSLGSVAVLALVITAGLLAMAPLGAEGVAAGVRAGLLTTVVGGVIYALLGRAAVPAAAPGSATALLLAALALELQADPALQGRTALLLTLLGTAVALCGVLQLLAAAAGLARLASYVPQPVVSGFMNGVALQIVIAQWPLLRGQPLGSAHAQMPAQPLAVVLGVATAIAIIVLTRRWPRLPAALLVLVAGTLAHIAVQHGLPQGALGERVGELPQLVSLPWAGAAGWWPAAQAHAGSLLLTALLLASVGTLETAMNAVAVDRQLETSHDPRRELAAIGATNVALGLLGGLPALLTRTRVVATVLAGGTGRRALIAGSIVLGVLVIAGRPVLAALPLPVLAGILLGVAWTLVDPWSLQLVRRLRPGSDGSSARLSLMVVVVVMVATLTLGLGAGVAIGALLSLLRFAVRMNRSLLRRHYSAAEQPSRRMRMPAVETVLRPLRQRVQIVELEGALFFGSGQRLLDALPRLPADCSALLLDAERVSSVDDSGVLLLYDLRRRLDARGAALRIAGLRPSIVAGWGADALAAALDPDLDRAVEWAEDRLLAGQVAVPAQLALHDTPLMQALDATDRPVLERLLVAQRLATGERLFAQGDPGDRLYLLLAGSISVLTEPDADGRSRRFLSLSPGTLLGETALLDGGGRSAGASADCESSVVWLDKAALAELQRARPDAAARLYRYIALHLSQRLRSATALARAQ